MEFETVIGLEIHAELATNTKAFCSCRVKYGAKPNNLCCPVCMGLPGALPKLNEKVVEFGVKMGISLNCKINNLSKSARKNYFYPDLPKGYQISQADMPLCENGFYKRNDKLIRINRIHIEEDAGKLIHEKSKTLIDYNRAGVPLIEIVTEPDIRSGEEAKEFLEDIRNILLYLEIAECKMQEGGLRCDVNVSVRKKGQTEYNSRCEMKNLNSFSAVVRAIAFEEARQKAIYLSGGAMHEETRRWDDEKGISILMRTKEGQADYRYFPEPDLPYVKITDEYIKTVKKTLPILPKDRLKSYMINYNLTENDAKVIVAQKAYAELFEEAMQFGADGKIVANFITGEISAIVAKKGIEAKNIPFNGKKLADVAKMAKTGQISITAGKAVLQTMFEENKSVEEIVKEKGFTQENDPQQLRLLVREALSENTKSVEDYKKGKKNAFSYIVGQCMKKSGNRANAKIVSELLKEEIGG